MTNNMSHSIGFLQQCWLWLRNTFLKVSPLKCCLNLLGSGILAVHTSPMSRLFIFATFLGHFPVVYNIWFASSNLSAICLKYIYGCTEVASLSFPSCCCQTTTNSVTSVLFICLFVCKLHTLFQCDNYERTVWWNRLLCSSRRGHVRVLSSW